LSRLAELPDPEQDPQFKTEIDKILKEPAQTKS